VTDWGTIAANPLLESPVEIAAGKQVTFTLGMAVHDGAWDRPQVESAFKDFQSRDAEA
jgi:hypothetical protein